MVDRDTGGDAALEISDEKALLLVFVYKFNSSLLYTMHASLSREGSRDGYRTGDKKYVPSFLNGVINRKILFQVLFNFVHLQLFILCDLER